jgi:hypothetical protein
MDSLVFSSCRYGHKLYLVIFDSLFGNPDIRTTCQADILTID